MKVIQGRPTKPPNDPRLREWMKAELRMTDDGVLMIRVPGHCPARWLEYFTCCGFEFDGGGYFLLRLEHESWF